MPTNTLRAPRRDIPRVVFSTRNLYLDLRDRLHVIAERRGWTLEHAFNVALRKGLKAMEESE